MWVHPVEVGLLDNHQTVKVSNSKTAGISQVYGIAVPAPAAQNHLNMSKLAVFGQFECLTMLWDPGSSESLNNLSL